jgi:hypothetical protein
MQLDFASLNYGRQGFGLPEARLTNMYPEITPQGPGKSARLPRPCLQSAYSLGTAGIRGLYSQSGVFNGDVFAVAGTTLYRGTDTVGTVALGSVVRWAASYTQLVCVVGGAAYCYSDSGFAQITIPDDLPVSDVFVLGSRFFFTIQGSDKFYWSDLDDATNINSLAFATADSAPDGIVGAGVLGSVAVFIGNASIEYWALTGDPDAPLVRQSGILGNKGCASQASIVYADNRLFWAAGSDLKFYAIGGGVPQRVSDHALEQRLRQCLAPERDCRLSADLGRSRFHRAERPWRRQLGAAHRVRRVAGVDEPR